MLFLRQQATSSLQMPCARPRLLQMQERHFSSAYLSESKNPMPTAALTSQQPSLSAASPVNSDDDKVNVFALVNGVLANCLIDTVAKRNHIDKAFIDRTNLSVNDSTKEEIGLAVKGSTVKTRSSCNVQIDLLDRSYDTVNMLVMDNLIWDVILGQEFLREHKSVIFEFGSPKCPLNLNSLDVLKGRTQARPWECNSYGNPMGNVPWDCYGMGQINMSHGQPWYYASSAFRAF